MKSVSKRPLSLALRLTLSIGAALSLLLLCFGWLVERSINTHFIQQDIDELNAINQSIQTTLAQTNPAETAQLLNQRFSNAISNHHSAEFLVLDANDNKVYATPYSRLEPLVDLFPRTSVISDATVHLWQHGGRHPNEHGPSNTFSAFYRRLSNRHRFSLAFSAKLSPLSSLAHTAGLLACHCRHLDRHLSRTCPNPKH
jgi:hypothetical protein